MQIYLDCKHHSSFTGVELPLSRLFECGRDHYTGFVCVTWATNQAALTRLQEKGLFPVGVCWIKEAELQFRKLLPQASVVFHWFNGYIRPCPIRSARQMCHSDERPQLNTLCFPFCGGVEMPSCVSSLTLIDTTVFSSAPSAEGDRLFPSKVSVKICTKSFKATSWSSSDWTGK